jgi:hypothetical protein
MCRANFTQVNVSEFPATGLSPLLEVEGVLELSVRDSDAFGVAHEGTTSTLAVYRFDTRKGHRVVDLESSTPRAVVARLCI